jgi:hypothetical protein
VGFLRILSTSSRHASAGYNPRQARGVTPVARRNRRVK